MNPTTGASPGDARRILIYGVSGSGKTTLANKVAKATGIAWHSVDDLTWEPGWVEVPAEEQRRGSVENPLRLLADLRNALRGLFSRESIIVWHFTSFARKRQRIRQWSTDPAAPPVLRFATPIQTERWLSALGEAAPPAGR